MIITKVRIKNYCSIRDSGDFYLEDRITCLAGKNESGKTAILHALADFDQTKNIRPDAKPIEYDTTPEISITFKISKEELTGFLKAVGVSSTNVPDLDMEVIKVPPAVYSLSQSTVDALSIITETDTQSLVDSAKKLLADLQQPLRDTVDPAQGVPTLPDNATGDDWITRITEFLDEVNPKLEAVKDKNTTKITQSLDQLKKTANDLRKKTGFVANITNAIINSLPEFIYFASFESLLPYEVALDQVANIQPAKDFFNVAGIDLAFLMDSTNSVQAKRNVLASKSTVITGDFLEYWAQEKIELTASLDASNVIFGFKEGKKSQEFTMEQRSKGFQWFLSFYMQLQLHEGTKKKYMLIDEPGLYLHAKAQEDVLKILEARSDNIPIVFSTHSPYLIEYDKLFRVRLVYKTSEKGTIVESKYHKISDKETLRPILTAIGLELTSGITNVDKLNNVIVEGPSDWYYLTAFKKILGNVNLNFIYGGGSGNMPHVGTILQGWGCRVLYLYDNDQGKKDGEKNLTVHWLAEQAQIKSISKDETVRAIEDLFKPEDFRTSVLENQAIKYNVSNSAYMVDKDKVLKAKKFMAKADSNLVEITDDTKDRFNTIMTELADAFAK